MHDLHSEYPLAVEKIKVTKEILHEYQLQIIEDNFSWGKNEKLIINLGNKRKHELHYQNLKSFFRVWCKTWYKNCNHLKTVPIMAI